MREKRHTAIKVLLTVAAIIILLIIIVYLVVIPLVKQEIASVAAEKLIETAVISNQDIQDTSDVGEILETIDEDDLETVEGICDSYITPEAISEIAPYIADGDIAAIIEYAEENISEEDMEQLMEIYREYSGEYEQ